MLTELQVSNLGVIEHAELVLGPGSSALTGETGAGKTLLVAAVGLLLGGRADRSLVRSGAREARVEGAFTIPATHAGAAIARNHGLVDDDAEGDVDLVVDRTVAADGKGKVRINGRIATVSTLQTLGEALAVIAGQHEHHRLDAPTFQRALLDEFAGPRAVELAATVRNEVIAVARAQRALEQLTDEERSRARERDLVAFEIKEIEATAPVPGETETLTVDARRLEHAATIAEAVDGAADALHGDRGAGETVAAAVDHLRAIEQQDPELAPLIARLEQVAVELADIGGELGARRVTPDPETLEQIRGRIGALARLRRKYGDTEADVLEHLSRAQARAGELDHADEGAERLTAEIAERKEAATTAATELTKLRASAARRLESEMDGLLGELALGDAHFMVALEEAELHEGGLERIEFRVATNQGTAPAPLAKVASGGELSRIALALHLLTATGDAPTMIFDEVDAGVGGRAAQAVGRCLAQLARNPGMQVLVVTHLPQVAAFADNHYTVLKDSATSTTTAVLEKVEGEDRVVELSRMLAGFPQSERAREHARELLDLATDEVAS
jgi:DNA repair protein RecN (Recombination protein N)